MYLRYQAFERRGIEFVYPGQTLMIKPNHAYIR